MELHKRVIKTYLASRVANYRTQYKFFKLYDHLINEHNIKCYLFVEDYLFDKHIREGNYRSQYTPKTLYKRLKKQIEARYSTLLRPVHKDYIGSEIYNTLESYVYEKFRHEGWIEGVDVND